MREHERGRPENRNAETPPNRPKLVLIVEDEASLVTSVAYYLR